jgi:plastocyanin
MWIDYDFSYGSEYFYTSFGDFDPWESTVKVAGGTKIVFYDADGGVIHSATGPNTMSLGAVGMWASFSLEEVEVDTAATAKFFFNQKGDYNAYQIGLS